MSYLPIIIAVFQSVSVSGHDEDGVGVQHNSGSPGGGAHATDPWRSDQRSHRLTQQGQVKVAFSQHGFQTSPNENDFDIEQKWIFIYIPLHVSECSLHIQCYVLFTWLLIYVYHCLLPNALYCQWLYFQLVMHSWSLLQKLIYKHFTFTITYIQFAWFQ